MILFVCELYFRMEGGMLGRGSPCEWMHHSQPWTGRELAPSYKMNRLSLRSTWLEFKALGKLPII